MVVDAAAFAGLEINDQQHTQTKPENVSQKGDAQKPMPQKSKDIKETRSSISSDRESSKKEESQRNVLNISSFVHTKYPKAEEAQKD